jgi:hypothetical protein
MARAKAALNPAISEICEFGKSRHHKISDFSVANYRWPDDNTHVAAISVAANNNNSNEL